jgi:hypothetical protein
MSRDPGWSGSAALASPAWAIKNRGPDPAHGSGGFGGLTAVALPRPGRRSPVDSAAGRRAPVRHEGADEESHCRLDRSLLNGGWSPDTRAASAADFGCRRSLRPALGRCQANYGVVDRGDQSCRSSREAVGSAAFARPGRSRVPGRVNRVSCRVLARGMSTGYGRQRLRPGVEILRVRCGTRRMGRFCVFVCLRRNRISRPIHRLDRTRRALLVNENEYLGPVVAIESIGTAEDHDAAAEHGGVRSHFSLWEDERPCDDRPVFGHSRLSGFGQDLFAVSSPHGTEPFKVATFRGLVGRLE